MLGLIKTMRIHQWSKNSLVFAALVFSQSLGNSHMVIQTIMAFLAFSLLSSSIYLINDTVDAEKDRLHPVKRKRPIAAGDVSKTSAVVAAACLMGMAFAWTAVLEHGAKFAGILLFYLLVNCCYNFFLKKIVIADVLTLAIGFLLRIRAGGVAIEVDVSEWLILCTFFTASFLACCKRRSELALAEGAPEAREVLSHYSFQILDVLIAMTASVSMMTYALYCVPGMANKTGSHPDTAGMIYSLPVVLFGIGRYIFLVYHRQEGEDPAAVILRDKGVIAAVILWLGIAMLVFYGNFEKNIPT